MPISGVNHIHVRPKKIGAFETSILPYRDCCSLRSPKPVLTARAQDLLLFSAKMDLDEAVEEALKDTVEVKIGGK